MAHWIIEDRGFGGNTYECSNCGESYNDLFRDPGQWDECPSCHARFKVEETEYISDLVNRPLAKMEKIRDLVGLEENSTEVEPIEPERLKDVVIMSLEKYDQMKADFEQCIEERDRALFEQEQELRNLQALVKAIGITPEMAKNVYPDSVEVYEEGNMINCTMRYHIKFDVRR